MKIQDLPESVTFNLDDDSAIQYPKNGEFEKTYQLELMCFGKKIYNKTWPLRTRLMQVFTSLSSKLGDLAEQTEKPDGEDDKPMDGEDLMNACLIGNFDAPAALEEFKQIIVSNDLIKLDDGIFMNKQRWAMVDEDIQEQIMFEYLANFIQPCVLTGKTKKS